jgi:hypothetical protein
VRSGHGEAVDHEGFYAIVTLGASPCLLSHRLPSLPSCATSPHWTRWHHRRGGLRAVVESVPAGAPRRWSRSSTARCCSAGRLETRVLMRRGSRSWGAGGARPRCPHGAAPFTRAAAISTPASCRWLLLSDAGGHEATPTSDARACTNAGLRLVRRVAPADRQQQGPSAC